MLEIKNGDVFDIGQTVNGVSKFLWFNGKWYYFEEMAHQRIMNHMELMTLKSKTKTDRITYINEESITISNK